MGQQRALGLVQQGHRLGQSLVQRRRAQAATHHQHPQRPTAVFEALQRRGQVFDLGAHRVAGDHAQLGLARRFTVKTEGHLVGHRQQALVAHQQGRIGVDQHQRFAQQRGHQAAGEADVSAHAKHGIRLAFANNLQTAPERAEQTQAAGQRVHQALATQAAERDVVHRDAARRHQLVFHAVGGTEPADRPATRLHFLGDSETGDDVATGTGGHDDEVLGAHARPPLISCRFSISIRSTIANATMFIKMAEPP